MCERLDLLEIFPVLCRTLGYYYVSVVYLPFQNNRKVQRLRRGSAEWQCRTFPEMGITNCNPVLVTNGYSPEGLVYARPKLRSIVHHGS